MEFTAGESLLEGLNEQQRAAVVHGEGPLLVVAAAGSGKTKVLTHRAGYLLANGIDPKKIALMTFTKKAGEEMKARLASLVGSVATMVSAGTIHSFMRRILVAEEWPYRFDVLDDYWKKRILRDEVKVQAENIKDVMSQISLWKNEMITPEEAMDINPRVARDYDDYERARIRGRKIDFDDMLWEAVKLFAARPEALTRVRNQFHWLLVDEVQDTNLVQYSSIESIAHPLDNITMVGDPRQALYSFRGARPEEVFALAERFPGLESISLPRNYRSTPEVVGAANLLISNADQDYDDMEPNRETGKEITYFGAQGPKDEAERVALEISLAHEDGRSWSDFSILYRTNAYSQEFEDVLSHRNIPYVIVGSAGFFGRGEVQDVMSYLRLVNDPRDDDALLRLINKPTRYLGKAFVEAVIRESQVSGDDLIRSLTRVNSYGTRSLSSSQKRNAAALRSGLERLATVAQEQGVYDAIEYVRSADGLGYDAWLLKEEGSGDIDNDRMGNLAQLAMKSNQFNSLDAFLLYAKQQQQAATGISADEEDESMDRVTLMTVHRSKGLEWPMVFVVGCSEGLMPHRLNSYGPGLEEERRIGYVALTRARDVLHVSSSGIPSRFIREAGLLPPEEEPEAPQPIDEETAIHALVVAGAGDEGEVREALDHAKTAYGVEYLECPNGHKWLASARKVGDLCYGCGEPLAEAR
jgi:DNA helicase-2/ATP-dependent DNA helicase PcrA